jgi:hypothetical protein
MVNRITYVQFCVESTVEVYSPLQKLEKPTDLSQATNKIYHMMLYTNQNAVVIGIYCIGSYKSNYHTITNTLQL